MPRLVPAWQVQQGSYTVPEWVHVFSPVLDNMGLPKLKTVNYLTPIDPQEQAHLEEMYAKRHKEILCPQNG